MTERRGRRARWTAAYLLAPGAAAMFGAAVSWASTTTPSTAGSATSGSTATTTGAAPGRVTGPAAAPRSGPTTPTVSAQARHWRAVAAHRRRQEQLLARRLTSLDRQIVRLHAARQHLAQAPAITVPAAPPPVQAPVVQAPAQAPAVQAPAPVVVQAPPVHSVTGSSGHP